MHFTTLPPEINSGRMHSGPGSESMTSAAAAWDRLATQLSEMAVAYAATTSTLARGPAAAAASRAAAPQIDWLKKAAAQAQTAAAQARAAASAYESALAAMAPPAVIDAILALRTSLASTNPLGHAGPAIAEADAEYERMWAQDADALTGYARASADAARMAPFRSPIGDAGRPRDNWTLAAAPEVVSTGHEVMSTIADALRELVSSPLATFDAPLLAITPSLSKLSSLTAPSGSAIIHLNAMNKGAALQALLPNPSGVRGAAVTAAFGRATAVGRLSVPDAWTTAIMPNPVETEDLSQGWAPVRLVAVSEPTRHQPAYRGVT
ncbi:MAG: PPE family protein [Mycobacterium sp.]|uniref:PPE family protein, SVP subgroup n=1 Tax=Mycobacterium sp. TaxID=1785 RepID=UPI001EB65917|nr:PPE domain-containing protein [Mycobacterium sp.]MBV8785479.1 PPE family protein [Mycobacterium sp.]